MFLVGQTKNTGKKTRKTADGKKVQEGSVIFFGVSSISLNQKRENKSLNYSIILVRSKRIFYSKLSKICGSE